MTSNLDLHRGVAMLLTVSLSFVASYIAAYQFSKTGTGGDSIILLSVFGIGIALAINLEIFWKKIDRYGWWTIKVLFSGWVIFLIFIGLTYYILTSVDAFTSTYNQIMIGGFLIKLWLVMAIIGLIKLLIWSVHLLDRLSDN